MGGMEDMIARTNRNFRDAQTKEEKFQRLQKAVEYAEKKNEPPEVRTEDLKWALEMLEQLRRSKRE